MVSLDSSMIVLTPDGLDVAVIPGRRDRNLVARHLLTVLHFVDVGDARGLASFRGVAVRTADGRRLALAAEPASLEWLFGVLETDDD